MSQPKENIVSKFKDVLSMGFNFIEDMYVGDTKTKYRIMTGVLDIDFLTHGFHAGDMITLCGRPGIGKTTFLLNLACAIGTRYKDKGAVFFVSTQSSEPQLGLKCIISGAKTIYSNVALGAILNNDWPKIANAAGRLSELQILFNADSKSLDEIVNACIHAKKENNIFLYLVDSLDLVGGEDESAIANCLIRLKRFAKEVAAPVVLTASVRMRKDNSDNIIDDSLYYMYEKYSDVVMTLTNEKCEHECQSVSHEPESKKHPTEGHYGFAAEDEIIILKKQYVVISVTKNKNGPTGQVRQCFIPRYYRFVSNMGLENVSLNEYGLDK